MASPTIQTLTSFSGADLVATFANKVIGELQQISWAVQRDKAPVFTMGSPDARSFSRGKRGLAGSMVFAVFDNDALVTALQSVWSEIAPVAMYTAASNVQLAGSEDFSTALDMIKWNNTISELQEGNYKADENSPLASITQSNRTGFGFSYDKTDTKRSSPIDAQTAPGSNNRYDASSGEWKESETQINVPAGFAPIRGENIIYADTLPPFDVTLTFASEYGHTAFQKIYDVDILNESSGASVDTVVMARQVTWIARRLSPLIRGVYTRDESGNVKGKLPEDVDTK